jgi:DNA primase
MISREIVEAVRLLSPIADVVAEQVSLRRSGHQLVGRCPFHADRTPSFAVHPEKGVFYCHGCGAGGDVFRFIQLLLKCTFREAANHLAIRAGLEPERFRPSAEFSAKVAAMRAQRAEQKQFEQFCNARLDAIAEKSRALGRAANDAEDFLRSGVDDPHRHDLAWDALKQYIDFQNRIERSGLDDLDVLRTEWEQTHAAA